LLSEPGSTLGLLATGQLDGKNMCTRNGAYGYHTHMDDATTPLAETVPWYEDPVKLRQKREEVGINATQFGPTS
jgi:hypothetical protein